MPAGLMGWCWFVNFPIVVMATTEKRSAPNSILVESIKHSPLPNILLDERGVVMSVNQAASKLLDTTEANLLNTPFETAIAPKIMVSESSAAPLWERVNQGVSGLEVNLQFSDTEAIKKAVLYARPFTSTEHHKRWVIVHLQDITSLRKMERNLRESRQRYEAIIREAGDGIVTIDKRGQIESVNAATERLFGYASKELLGQNISILMPSPDREQHDRYLENYQRGGQARIIGKGREVMGRHKSGRTFPIYLNVSEVKLKDRVMYTGMLHDLSELKEAEEKLKEYASELEAINDVLEDRVKARTQELDRAVSTLMERNAEMEEQIEAKEKAKAALKESEGLFQAVTEQFPGGFIAVYNQKGECLLLEGKELSLLKRYFENDLNGSHWQDKFSRYLFQQVVHYKQSVLLGNSMTRDLQIGANHYQVNLSPLPIDFDQADKRLMLVSKNITEQKHAQLNTLKALSKEKKLNELKSRFMTMASHEFRTPLATVLSSASLIERYTESHQQENRKKHINRIKSAVSNVNQTLTEFISLEKLQEGLIKVQPEPIYLPSFYQDIVGEMESILKKDQRIYLKTEGAEIFVQEPHLLKNILINLLSNASKYSEEGAVLYLRSQNRAQLLHIEVEDEGFGISEDDQKNLFQWFFRGENVANIQGTGIGLYIVKKYADLMHGNIQFESVLGKGTKFKLEFKPLDNGEASGGGGPRRNA